MMPVTLPNHSIDVPRVSIVTPSYNQAKFLERTLLSVLNQDYPNIEYIVIDGGSADGSIDIIRKYKHRLAYWVSEPDRGQAHAINKGWQRATGDVVAYLNSDDLYMPGAVTRAVQTLMAHVNAAMVYSDALYVDEHGSSLGIRHASPFNLRHVITTEAFMPQPTVFIRRQALDDVGLLDERLHMVMDYDLWLRLGLHHDAVYLQGTCLAAAREHASAKSTAAVKRFPVERRRALNKLYSRIDLPDHIAGFRGAAFASTSFQQAVLAGRDGSATDVAYPLFRAVAESPSYVAKRPFTLFLMARILLPMWKKGLPPRAWQLIDRAMEHIHASRRDPQSITRSL